MIQENDYYEEWIKQEFPLLCGSSFLNKEAALMQFGLLSARALRSGPAGDQARSGITYLLLRNGAPVDSSIRHIISRKCALLVRKLLSMPEHRESLRPTFTGVLAQCKNCSVENRLLVLDGLKQSLISNNEKPSPSREFFCDLFIRALKLELTRALSEQSREFQCRLLELIELYPHPEAPAILAAIAAESADDEVRLIAREVLGKIADELGRMWIATTGDEVSSGRFLAGEMEEALGQELTDLEKAQAIFNACKSQVPEPLVDPRLQLLRKLMAAADSPVLVTAGSMAYWHMQSNRTLSGSKRREAADYGRI